jgi:hypothetical protein
MKHRRFIIKSICNHKKYFFGRPYEAIKEYKLLSKLEDMIIKDNKATLEECARRG